jgi:hypothetical protein
LTASRFSRAVYGVSKVIAFVLLGVILALNRGHEEGINWISESWLNTTIFITNIIVWTMVVFNLLRGIPVLVDGRFYLFEKYLPRELKSDG